MGFISIIPNLKNMEKINDSQKEKINIKYIAKLASVSPSTVSRALRNDPEANKKTINKIKKIAKKLNYYPDLAAKSLRENKSNIIGIIFNDMNNPFYNDVLWAIYNKLDELSYSMIVTYSNWDIDNEKKNIINLISRKVDGVIISPINENAENRIILEEKNIETVYVDTCPIGGKVSYSGSDHKKAIYLATKHLIDNGHKNILFYSAMPLTSYALQFIRGYYLAL